MQLPTQGSGERLAFRVARSPLFEVWALIGTVGSKKLEYAGGFMLVFLLVKPLGLWDNHESYSNLLAPTVPDQGPILQARGWTVDALPLKPGHPLQTSDHFVVAQRMPGERPDLY